MTLPTGQQQNDLLIALLAFGENISGLGGLSSWTLYPTGDTVDGTTGHYLVYYKIAGSSESAPTVTWTTNSKPMFQVSAYRGCDTITPIINSSGALDTANDATISTPTVNNTGSGVEWAVMLSAFRTTTSGNKTNDFTADAALLERADQNNSGAGSAAWMSAETADSNGTVTAGNHSYTSTVNNGGNSTHKFGALLYIAPAASNADFPYQKQPYPNLLQF